MNCGEKIAELRKKRGMTQDELGKTMNVSYQAVSKWERDESQPDFETMSKIAKLFGVPLGYFADDESESQLSAQSAYAEAPAVSAPAPAQKTLMGTCTQCGKVVYEGEAGETSPKLLCRACHTQKEEERRRKREQIEKDAREYDRDILKVKRRGFLWGTIAAIIVFIIGASVYLSDKSFFKENLIGCLAASFLLPILAFAAVSRLRWFIGTLDDDEVKYKVSTSLIIGALFAAGNIALISVYYCSVDFIDATTFAVCLVVFALLSFLFVSQYLWGGIVRGICFAGGLVLKMPGIIFNLSVGGIITFILVKVLFGIIVMLVFFFSVLICETAAIVFSVFSFVPSLIRRIKEQKNDI